MKRSPALEALGVLLLAVFTLWAVYFLCYRRFVADRVIRTAEARTIRILSLPDFRRAAMARGNIALLEGARTGSPDDQRMLIAKASNNLLIERYPEAIAIYQEALSWGKRPEIYLNLATSQAGSGDREAAIETLTLLARLDPMMLANCPFGDVREAALARFAAASAPELTADVYLNLAIQYFNDGLLDDGVDAAATGALYDPKILTRRELLSWGLPAYEARYRYQELKRQNRKPDAR